MDTKEYIESGILELYVYGALTEAENEEVARMVKKYPELEAEVEEIEKILLNLSAAAAPGNPQFLLDILKTKRFEKDAAVQVRPKKKNWPAYIGWAASILLLVGLFFMFNKNRELRVSLQALQVQRARMESQIADVRNDAEKTKELLEVLRDRNVVRVPLEGQATAPGAYATAWWDQSTNTTYIDAQNLPEPPRGMVYQVWSLKLQPLTPTSIGLLDDFEDDDNKIFELQNPDASEGFGITLEPEGGSETPTMERLYSFGTVSS